MVANVLSDAWRAYKTRPFLLSFMQAVLYPVPLLLLFVAMIFSLVGSGRPGSGGLTGVAVAVMGYSILRVGYDALALKVVRGEAASAITVFSAIWRSFWIVLAIASITLLVGLIIGPAVLLFMAIDALDISRLFSLLPAILVGAAFWVAWIGGALLLFGVIPWPMVLMDRKLGAWAAMREAWALTEGHRWSVLSLFFALTILNTVGLLAFGVGLLVTAPIAACARAALYTRLVEEKKRKAFFEKVGGEQPHEATSTAPRRRPLSALVVDGWIILYATATGMLAVMVSTIRPIIDRMGNSWSPYREAMFVALVVLTPIVLLVLFIIFIRRMGWTPGARIVAEGWGRFEWLAILSAIALAFMTWRVLAAAGVAVVGFTAMGVGSEMAHTMIADLSDGHSSQPDLAYGTDWLRKLDIGSDDVSLVQKRYTVTDTVGTPYFFAVARYYHEPTATAMMQRLEGGDAKVTSVLEADAIEVRDETAGWVRIAVLDGSTILAGEAGVDHVEKLYDLMAHQLSRLDAARERVAPVYERLPKPVQRLPIDEPVDAVHEE